MDKKLTMHISDLNEAIDQLAKANSVRWCGRALRKDKNNFLRRALDFEVKWTRKRCRPKKTWLNAFVEHSRKLGLNEGDADNRSRWRLGVYAIHSKMR